MNFLVSFLVVAVLLLGTAAFNWREGAYQSCGLHVVLGFACLSITGLLAVGAHL